MVRMTRNARRKNIDQSTSLYRNLPLVFVLVGFVAGTSYYYINTDGEGVISNDHNPGLQSESKSSNMILGKMGLSSNAASAIISANKSFLVYGTAWKKESTAELVEQAVKSGFRFIDTACQPKHYNEAGVGEGWFKAAQDLNLDRKEIFLQTKFTSLDGQDPNNIPYDENADLEEQVRQSLEVSLKNLKSDYLDSLVMHSPERSIEDTMRVYRTMESFVEAGIVLRLGISNCYDYKTFTTIYEQAKIKPSVLQNRLYEQSGFDNELRQFCKDNGIWYQSFWTLTANINALRSIQIREWAAKRSLTPQTLMFAFLLQLGYITPLSGTTNLRHMKEDVDIMERIQKGEKVFQDQDELELFASLIGMKI